jgi:hypothetical protein
MVIGEGLENFATLFRDGEDDAAAIVGVFGADEEAFGDGAVYQLDYGVVTESEALCGVGDGGYRAVGCAGDLEEQLVLLGMQIDFVSGLLAEVCEGAEVIAEFGERLEEGGFAVGSGVFWCHAIYIVSRYKYVKLDYVGKCLI